MLFLGCVVLAVNVPQSLALEWLCEVFVTVAKPTPTVMAQQSRNIHVLNTRETGCRAADRGVQVM